MNLFIKSFLILTAITTIYSCTSRDKFDIEAIDKNLNGQLRTGKGLNQNLFSSKDKLQYFQVSGYTALKPSDFKSKLNGFIDKNYRFEEISKSRQFTLFFYRKVLFTNYGDYVYEAARDTETGNIEKYKDNLVAMIWFTKMKGDQLTRNTVIYDKEVKVLDETDTLRYKTKL